jgi:hypothetical protein
MVVGNMLVLHHVLKVADQLGSAKVIGLGGDRGLVHVEDDAEARPDVIEGDIREGPIGLSLSRTMLKGRLFSAA